MWPAGTVWFGGGVGFNGALLTDIKDLACRANTGVLLDISPDAVEVLTTSRHPLVTLAERSS